MASKKKIVKKPIKKTAPKKKPVKKTNPPRGVTQTSTQSQNVVVNVHTGKSASQGKSKSKASSSSKVERVTPMANYQASESPYPSYVRQSVAVPIEAGNPAFASVGQTVGPIQNRIPVFADAAKPSVNPPDEPVLQYPQQDVTVTDEKPVVTKKARKSRKKPEPEPSPVVVSNVGIESESESGIANVFTPQEPAGIKPPAGSAFSGIFQPVGKQSTPPPSGSFKLKPQPPLPTERTRKTPAGSREDLRERFYKQTSTEWEDVKKNRKTKEDTAFLRQAVADLESGRKTKKEVLQEINDRKAGVAR